MARHTESVEESKELNQQLGPMVVIVASGMAESGRILHHLLHGASDPQKTVVIVGFMAENTLGRRIAARRAVLKVYGGEVVLRAHVEQIHGYSAHARRSERKGWIDAVRRTSPSFGNVWLVHGEPDAQDAPSTTLGTAGYRVRCPASGTRADV
jgi:metallo-beta-lactamase family protein